MNVRFADCRYDLADPAQARERYLQAHIPGAVFVDLDTDLSDLSIPPEVAGRHPLPGAEQFAASMSRAVRCTSQMAPCQLIKSVFSL